MTLWTEVLPEHRANVGFIEGANNQNPWGPEQGVFNASYCESAASMVPYHHGVRYWLEAQFGEKGWAYTPFAVNDAIHHGCFQYDHASSGRPCDLLPGDKVYFSWNGDTLADHVETVIAVYADGTFDTIGYNTGHPEGCHIIRRDRYYLLGRFRMQGVFYGEAPKVPIPMPNIPINTPKKEDETVAVAIIRIPDNSPVGAGSIWNLSEAGRWYIQDAIMELPLEDWFIVHGNNVSELHYDADPKKDQVAGFLRIPVLANSFCPNGLGQKT